MKRTIFVILVFFALFFSFNIAGAESNGHQLQQEEILSAADNLFVFMKNKNYIAIWTSLSKKSQTIIVDDVSKENEKANKNDKKLNLETNREALFKDFSTGGENAKAYWHGFLTVFNPDIVLQRCTWNMGKIEKNEAEIFLQNKTAEKPAIIKMFKENNEWKVGLEESFGARKLLIF